MGTAVASDYLENQLIDHLFRSGTFPKPAGLYVALFTAAPSDAGGGTEVAGGGYARVNLPPSDTNWQATQGGPVGTSTGTGGRTSNAVTIAFPAASADWGTITHYGIFDAATAGNRLLWDAVTVPRKVLAGDPPIQFTGGTLQITIG